MFSARFISRFCIFISFIWFINLMAPLFLDNYTPDPMVNVPFMAVVGVILTGKGLGGKDRRGGDEEE